MSLDEFSEKLNGVYGGNKELISELLAAYEGLMDDYADIVHKYEELEQNLHDNYRPIPLDSVDMYG